ncbi:MAG: hypothetical protein HDR88_14620 [Bacteroides sp.]|nr:hypothetical protein [Bacteroides sp.]
MSKKSIIISILSFIVFFSAIDGNATLTPEQIAQKAASVISNSKSISAAFTLSGNGRKSTGTLKSSGNKFAVILPEVSSWYNGTFLYTYNPRIGETTVTTPTAVELMESNPLLYVKGGGSQYTYKFSPVKRNGKYVIDLFPMKDKSGVKKLTFTINSSNFHTEKIVVTTSGGAMTIDVTSFIPGAGMSDSEFEYPKLKYPKAEIIDLR